MAKPTINVVGEFIDNKAGKIRTPQAVAGRTIEELVELMLEVHMTPGQIMGHVMDALHNQTLKHSNRIGHTLFPSELNTGDKNSAEFIQPIHTIAVMQEAADVNLCLLDFLHVMGNISQDRFDATLANIWENFTHRQFRVNDKGLLYAKKAHIQGKAPSGEDK